MKKSIVKIAPLVIFACALYWGVLGFKLGTIWLGVCFCVLAIIVLLIFGMEWWSNFIDRYIKD